MTGRHNSSNQYFFSPLEKQTEDKSECKLFDSENNQAALQKILLGRAETCEEKFKILDARDKLYKLMQYTIPTLQRKALPAICPDMCPEKERLLREYQGRGSVFEMSNFSRNSAFNHNLAVKEYARSSADQEEPLPHELRPISVLTMTMNHLLHNVVDYCELNDDNLEEWYMFMWDRTRALRKELTQQGLCSLESVTLVEQCARFHIHCAERLIDQDSSIYDDKINTENLTKCLQTLKYMYKDLAKEDIKCPNESEFVCYTLLLNLNNSSVFTELSDMSDSLMASLPVKFALNIMTTWETRNYIRFFDLIKKASYLNCCLLRRYFGEMRLYAIKTMIRSYCTKNYSPQIPLTRFVKNLNFEGEEECLNFLAECNFNFRECNGITVVNFNRMLFQNPENTFAKGRAYLFIEEKKTEPLSMILAGGTLPPESNKDHIPENSFTENGELKSEVLAKFCLSDVSVAQQSSMANPQLTFFDIPSDQCGETVTTSDALSVEMSSDMQTFDNEKSSEFLRESDISKKEEIPSLLGSRSFSTKALSSSNNIFNSPKNTSTFPLESASYNSKIWEESGQSNVPETKSTIMFGTIPKINPFETNDFESKNYIMPFEFQRDDESKRDQKHDYQLPAFGFGKTLSEIEKPEKPMTLPNIDFTKNFDFTPKLPDNSSSLGVKSAESKTSIIARCFSLEKEQSEKKNFQTKYEDKEPKENKTFGEEEEEEKGKGGIEEFEREDLEKRETKKREEEEKFGKKEQIRLAAEEVKKKEEIERQEKISIETELRKLEENKKKEELLHRLKIDSKMVELKNNWIKWKMKIIFDKWRIKTWSRVEERKVSQYLREVKKKYPPVCTEELLISNPYGLVIPNTLILEKFQNWKREFRRRGLKQRNKMLIVSDDLPLLKLDIILGKYLEARAKSLGYKADSFPWKLVISVPDESESPKLSKSIEIFIEMHFVCDRLWEFGVQKGPLYCQKGVYKSFHFNISVRRLKGSELFEGNEPNSSAAEGCNAIIFVLDGKGNEKSCERLKAVVTSRRPQPKIPIILFILGDDAVESNLIKERLGLEILRKAHLQEYHFISILNGQHDLINRLIDCLNLAAKISSPPSSLRLNRLSEFFSETRLDFIWRRIGIGLSNFRITLDEPKILIEFYNSCIDYLIDVFLDDSYEKQSVLGEEFSQVELNRPKRSFIYAERLKEILGRIKLPHWPTMTPKSSHQLNYRIHQYCKKIIGVERLKVRNFKWRLYRIIRRALLWKGLDIYCDEDIKEILTNFPWIQVFQEISRFLLHRFTEEVKSDDNLVVIYDLEKTEKFSFETSFIGKLLKRTKRKASIFGDRDEYELEELSPCPENDSIVYAYSVALERERNKRKREECLDDGLDGLFSSPAEKHIILEKNEIVRGRGEDGKQKENKEVRDYDFSQIECSFQCLNDSLEELKRQTAENESILMDIHSQFN